MTADWFDGTQSRQAAEDTLGELLDGVRRARRTVESRRRIPVVRDELVQARADLVCALERYATALEVRRLPLPPALRRELQLNRGIAGRY